MLLHFYATFLVQWPNSNTFAHVSANMQFTAELIDKCALVQRCESFLIVLDGRFCKKKKKKKRTKTKDKHAAEAKHSTSHRPTSMTPETNSESWSDTVIQPRRLKKALLTSMVQQDAKSNAWRGVKVGHLCPQHFHLRMMAGLVVETLERWEQLMSAIGN